HVLDPREIVRVFASAAAARGTMVQRLDVRALRPHGDDIEVLGDDAAFTVRAAVVCAGMGSAPLLAPFGLLAPLQAVRGYHIEIPGHEPFLGAPVVCSREQVIVTPMAGRLRASSYMEFAATNAPGDPRKPARLRQKRRAWGYACQAEGPSWVGARPVLPDYLPGIGWASSQAKLF